jgi:hypothetical protein
LILGKLGAFEGGVDLDQAVSKCLELFVGGIRLDKKLAKSRSQFDLHFDTHSSINMKTCHNNPFKKEPCDVVRRHSADASGHALCGFRVKDFPRGGQKPLFSRVNERPDRSEGRLSSGPKPAPAAGLPTPAARPRGIEPPLGGQVLPSSHALSNIYENRRLLLAELANA